MRTPSPVKRVVAQLLATFALMFLVFISYVSYATHRGQSKAEAVCQSIPLGETQQKASVMLLEADSVSRLKLFSERQLTIGFEGAFLDRWLCNVEISNGKVLSREVRVLD